ncbi:MAG TPA: DUF4386 family protein [Bellilinea sp.]|nr:DUF4386 family protein [Bellilinea sp.]
MAIVPLSDQAESQWKLLFRIGATAGIAQLLIMVIQLVVFSVWPPPTSAASFFALFERNWLLGLLSLDLLYILNNMLLIPIYLALYVALKRTNESAMLLALILGLVGISAYFSSSVAFEMLSLSGQFTTADGPSRSILLSSGQTLLEMYKGSAFDVYYVLNAAALLILAFVMRRSPVFTRVTAAWGIAAGILMIVPSSAGTLGMIFALASLAPWAVFLVLITISFIRLGKSDTGWEAGADVSG